MPTDDRADPTVRELLRAYLDAVTASEPLQGRIWAASQLTLTQVRALRRLAKESKPLGQLGGELGLAPPSITRLVDRLEERGLIERRRDAADRRKVVGAILPAGRRLISSLPQLERSPIGDAVLQLRPSDRKRIAAAFAEFVRAVRAAEETEAEPVAVS